MLAGMVRLGLACALAFALAGCGGTDERVTPVGTGGGGGSGGAGAGGAPIDAPAWVIDPHIEVSGLDNINNTECRDAICQHNENTDLLGWNGVTWLVHRTANSQVLGPNSSLHVYKSTDA